jgi:hypothetical protein
MAALGTMRLPEDGKKISSFSSRLPFGQTRLPNEGFGSKTNLGGNVR